ncbi:unnamed protein product [Medioppia subpectinata]|uniref:Uncharacterized protein n=1 Tax=Medioppia subpectinata TaxID=1979941 RepID=A0A7R9Q5X8_9ACAR|nr:unnamed protein product [Medioppia subpectinata]CAG2113814.1 unnamed protein product [Medioppia subpectinata]
MCPKLVSADFNDFPDAFNEQIIVNDIMADAYSTGATVQAYLQAAMQQDRAKGLTVVAQFYQDSIQAFKPIMPWLFAELDKVTPFALKHTLTTIWVAQFYDFEYMCERLTELRAVKPLALAGNELTLINRLTALESRVLAAVESSKGRGLEPNHPIYVAYLDKIKSFLSAEFPKLNQAIGNLPSAALRQQNLQQLVIDLTHLAEMPFPL